MFSFGIVLCEVGPGVGSSWHQVRWLLSTPYSPRLQAGEAPGNWAPTAICIQAQCKLPSNASWVGVGPSPKRPWLTAGRVLDRSSGG